MRLKLDEWRRARNITQEQMAKRLNISKPTYVRWERDPGKISIFDCQRIAKILEVDVWDIIFCPEMLQKVT